MRKRGSSSSKTGLRANGAVALRTVAAGVEAARSAALRGAAGLALVRLRGGGGSLRVVEALPAWLRWSPVSASLDERTPAGAALAAPTADFSARFVLDPITFHGGSRGPWVVPAAQGLQDPRPNRAGGSVISFCIDYEKIHGGANRTVPVRLARRTLAAGLVRRPDRRSSVRISARDRSVGWRAGGRHRRSGATSDTGATS